jgi:hypothetical protein
MTKKVRRRKRKRNLKERDRVAVMDRKAVVVV